MEYKQTYKSGWAAFTLLLAMQIALQTLVAACGGNKEAPVVSNRVAQATASSNNEKTDDAKKEVKEQLDKLVVAKDEHGVPTEIEGLSTAANKEASGAKLPVVNPLPELSPTMGPDEKLFTFSVPSGLRASFSSPMLVDASYLGLAPEALCPKASYSDREPTMKDVFDFAQGKQLCGEVPVGFCIRAVPTDGQRSEVGYLKTPALRLNILCPNTTFAGLQFNLAPVSDLRPDTVRVKAQASSMVTGLYVTNSPDCTSGGSWKTFAKEIAFDWQLKQDPYQPKVYGQFINVWGEKSGCLSAELPLGDLNTTPPSLRIASYKLVAGTSYDAEVVFGPSLATQMAFADNADCSNAGPWEAFRLSSTRRLEVIDKQLSAYAKLRDAAGGESACLAASVPVDGELPTGVGLVINGGLPYTVSTDVTLSLSSQNAASMYISNRAGCQIGGAWEAFAPQKTWRLALPNSQNQVFAKVKTRSGGESDCVVASIVHDALPPSEPALEIEAGRPYTNSLAVSLNPAAIGAAEMFLTNAPDCASGGHWEVFSSQKPWSLASANSLNNVYAKYRDAAGNVTACVRASITHDNLPPSAASVVIAGGSAYTMTGNVVLTLASTGADEMYLSNSPSCADGGSWEPYATSRAWVLGQSNASATVYAKFRDKAGNESACVDDAIVHDNLPPSATSLVINGGATYASGTGVSLTLAANGASHMLVTNTAGCGAGANWEAYAASKAWTLAQTSGTATVYAKFKDAAGNESPCLSDTILHDNLPPENASIQINNNAALTRLAAVSLQLAATGATEMSISHAADCSGSAWEAFALTKAWTLAATNTTVNVYAKFRDAAGNETGCLSDAIVHDALPPSGANLVIAGGATYTTSSSVALSLAATGATAMYISNSAACASGGAWEPFATSKTWTLAQNNATATVYAKFKDAADNETACLSDSIVHDDIAPTGSVGIAGGLLSTTVSTVSLSLSAVAATEMYVTNSANCQSGGVWEALAANRTWTLAQLNATATIYAKFRDAAGNQSSCLSTSILHDATPPAGASIEIAGGATHTNTSGVSLGLQATGASEMYVSHTATCSSGGSWEPYAVSRSWTLAQLNTTATVYVKYRDAAGNETACVSDSIEHDALPPTGAAVEIAGGAAYTNNSSVSLGLTASGATMMYLTNTAGCASDGAWQSFAASRAWTLGQSNATATVYVKYRDAANNESACVSDSIVHDAIAPSATSLVIAGGAALTTAATVNLTLAASGASEVYVTNTASCSGNGMWEAYTTSKTWTLAQLNATASVYAKFRDTAGNESSCVSDSIVHDSQAPTGGSIDIAGGAAYTSNSSVSLTLAASGASEMYISNTALCAGGGSWEAFAASKSWTLGQTNATASVYVKYRDTAGNETSCYSDSIVHDTLPPTGVNVDIAGGAPYTAVTSLSLSLAATGASQMYLTNTAACASGGTWEAFATSKAWTLGQTNAVATVYAKYRDAAGNESSCVSDTIVHDGQPPSGASVVINSGATYVNTATVTLTLAATDADMMYVTNNASCGSGGSWQAYATSRSWTLGQLQGMATVYVKFKDNSGNESSCASDTIVHDSIAPGPSSLEINGGASHTSSTTVSVALSSTGASEMLVSTLAGCSSGTWQAFVGSLNMTLPATNATVSLYAKFRDSAGNESSCVSDSIIHDNQGPTGVSVVIGGGMPYTTTANVTLTLAATDASEVYVTNTTNCGGDGTWEAFTASKTWTLAQTNSAARVYAKYRDGAGNESSCVSDMITHDSIGPSAGSVTIDAGATHTRAIWVNLTIAATGADQMQVSESTNCNSGTWEAYNVSRSWMLGQYNATVPVSVKFRDNAGNESACVTDTIVQDTIAPTGTIAINNDYPYTTVTTVGLTIAAAGATSMYITSEMCATGGTWEPYAPFKAWTLARTNAVATVYVIFRDDAGNVSSCYADNILHDNIPPTTPTNLASNPSARGPARSAWFWWTGSTDSGSGLLRYEVALGSSFGAMDQMGWTDARTLTAVQVTFSGRKFILGQNYHISVRARDNAGNYSAVASGGSFTMGWYQEAYLKAPNAEGGDLFGQTVAISGDTVAVAAPKEDSALSTITNGTLSNTSNAASNSGGVYVYQRTDLGTFSAGNTGVTWANQAFIKPANNRANLEFGQSLSLDGDTLAVSSEKDVSTQATITNGTLAATDGTSNAHGAAWVYKRTGTSWEQQAYIKRNGNDPSWQYGHLVRLKDNRLAVAAPHDDAVSAGAGAVHTYTRTGDTWASEAVVGDVTPLTNAYFGKSLALSSDRLVVGSPADGSPETTVTNGSWSAATPVGTPGAVLVYRRSGASWVAEAKLKTSNNDGSDQIGDGNAVAIDNETIAVGVYCEDSDQTTISLGSTAAANNNRADSGAVYVYKRTATSWAQEAYLKASTSDLGDQFGRSVAVEGNILAVGAPYEDSNTLVVTNSANAPADNSALDSGAVFVYTRTGTSWAQTGHLKATYWTQMADARFGASVAISNQTIAVGAPGESYATTTITNDHTTPFRTDIAPAAETGAVFIFRYPPY